MVSALFDIAPIFESIGSGSLLLTPNRRLAAHVQSAYAEACSQRGLSVWESPAILPLDEWLQNCWLQLIAGNSNLSQQLILLQPQQEVLLWEQIVRSDEKSVLLTPYATAKQAQSAFRVLQLWQTELGQEFYFHPDCARFAHWAKQFQQLCLQSGFISSSALPQLLINAFEVQQLISPERIILVGFQHLPPLHKELLDAAGAEVSQHQPETTAAKKQKLACNDGLHELQAAANWAKQKLEANPQLRIGIVVPDLAQQRARIEAVLTAVFEPQYVLPETARYQLPFNISAGIALNQTPLIDSALLLVALLRDEFDYQDLYSLLSSPFIQSHNRSFPDAGFGASSELEVFLREGGWPVYSLSDLRYRLKTNPRIAAQYKPFITAIEAAFLLQKTHRRAKANVASWVTVFKMLLCDFKWPCTERRLDSIEYQQLTRWQQALSDFSNLAPLCGQVTLNEALGLLARHIGSIDFQAQSAQTPLQVLGLLEASGLQFDALWLVGMNDHLWPPSANPSPFIPVNLQREHNMPHASAERELEFARELLKGFERSSHNIVASYALQSDDQILRPSTLITEFDDTTLAEQGLLQNSLPHPYYQLLISETQSSFGLEVVIDNMAPIINLENEAIHGGSSILKAQAACPFKAFAKHRLDAQELPEPSYHLSPAQRGIALHSALETLWETLKDSSQLAASDGESLRSLIEHCVTNALNPLARQREDLFGEVFTSSESRRLASLLEQWLAVEQSRAPFEVVATEKTLLLNLDGLPIRVRIDRIDRLEDGSLALIDYKTGYCSTSKWLGERLEEPQLPLYSVTFAGLETENDPPEGDIQTIAFAQINVEKQGFVGISAQQGIAPGISDIDNSRGWPANQNWSDLNAQWRQTLQNLSQQFVSGLAEVNPVNKSTCQFCHLHSLCRVHEQRKQPGIRGDADA